MNDQLKLKRAKHVYEIFCKLSARNTVKKRGSVICRETDYYYTPQKAVDNFFNAIMRAEAETAVERVILVALRDLPTRQIHTLKERLKEFCLQQEVMHM